MQKILAIHAITIAIIRNVNCITFLSNKKIVGPISCAFGITKRNTNGITFVINKINHKDNL